MQLKTCFAVWTFENHKTYYFHTVWLEYNPTTSALPTLWWCQEILHNYFRASWPWNDGQKWITPGVKLLWKQQPLSLKRGCLFFWKLKRVAHFEFRIYLWNLNPWLSTWVSDAKVAARFADAIPSQYAESAANSKTPCVCACPNVISQSCAWALPQELGHWFCSQYLWLLSGTVYESYCQTTGSSSNLDSNLNFAAWPTSCKGFILSSQKSQNTMFGLGILLRYLFVELFQVILQNLSFDREPKHSQWHHAQARYSGYLFIITIVWLVWKGAKSTWFWQHIQRSRFCNLIPVHSLLSLCICYCKTVILEFAGWWLKIVASTLASATDLEKNETLQLLQLIIRL